MPDQPKTILYLRPDSIGDLILFTPALDLFLAEWPNARHVIVVRVEQKSRWRQTVEGDLVKEVMGKLPDSVTVTGSAGKSE